MRVEFELGPTRVRHAERFFAAVDALFLRWVLAVLSHRS